MTYINGTITNANPGPALYAAIETAMLAQGWTLVDTVVIGANTHKVLKSAAAGNERNLDWYLDINYPTTGVTGGMRFAPFEDYNPTSKLGFRGPYAASGAVTVDPTTYSRYGSTGYALETNWLNSATYTGISMTLSTGAFDYRISVTRNRIIGNLTTLPAKMFYTGFFNPSDAHAAWAGEALFPLLQTVLGTDINYAASNSTVSHSAAVTRLPKISALVSNGWRYHCGVSSRIEALGGCPEGTIGVTTSPFTGRTTMKPPVVIFGDGTNLVNTISYTMQGVAEVGTLNDMGIGFVSATSVRGDTVVIGSDTWIAATPPTSYYAGLFFKAI